MCPKRSIATVNRRPVLLLTWMTALLTFLVCLEPAHADRAKRKVKKEQKKQERGAELESLSYQPGPGWEPYLEDEDGFRMKIVIPIEQNEDKDWMGLRFTEYQGPKLRLAVMQVDNRSNYGKGVPLNGIESLFSSGLKQTGRFDLVERELLSSVFAEQDLGDSGRLAKPSAAKKSQVLGAQYQVFATVVEWTPRKKSRGGGLMGLRVGKNEAEVAISVRVVDANTSQTLFAETERATASDWSFGFTSRRHAHGNRYSTRGPDMNADLGFDSASPIGYAVQSTINKAVYRLAMGLKDQKWRGAVMRADGRTVYINAGENLGMKVGYRLTCLSKGAALVDPATGIELGFEKTAMGTVAITGVEEAYSVSQIVNGCQGLKPGDFLELESTEEPQTAAVARPRASEVSEPESAREPRAVARPQASEVSEPESSGEPQAVARPVANGVSKPDSTGEPQAVARPHQVIES